MSLLSEILPENSMPTRRFALVVTISADDWDTVLAHELNLVVTELRSFGPRLRHCVVKSATSSHVINIIDLPSPPDLPSTTCSCPVTVSLNDLFVPGDPVPVPVPVRSPHSAFDLTTDPARASLDGLVSDGVIDHRVQYLCPQCTRVLIEVPASSLDSQRPSRILDCKTCEYNEEVVRTGFALSECRIHDVYYLKERD